MFESPISKDGLTTLPKSVRDALGVHPGDRIRYVVVGSEVRFLPVRPLERLFEKLQYDDPPIREGEMEQAIVDGATEE